MNSPGRVRALWMGGVVALSLHALVLSFLQLRDLRRRTPERLQSRDNTPELLQFASQASQIEPGTEGTAPRIPQLPPPPTPRNPLNPSVPSRERGASSAGRATRMPSSGVPPRAGAMAAREGRRTTLSNARRNLADRDQRQDGSPSRSRRSLQSEAASHWAAALERLQAVGSQNLAIREAPKGTAGSSAAAWVMVEGKAVIRLDANSSLGQAYQTLWTEASPQKIQPTLNGLDGPGAPVEVRRVSWRNVRDAELPIRHGQVLILADKTFLVWLTDDQLYLLQASPTAESRG